MVIPDSRVGGVNGAQDDRRAKTCGFAVAGRMAVGMVRPRETRPMGSTSAMLGFSRGSTPACTSDDLPTPDGPCRTVSRLACHRSASSCRSLSRA